MHKIIDNLTDFRIRQNREFFNVAPQKALEIFKEIAQTIDDAVITEYENNQPLRSDNFISQSVQNELPRKCTNSRKDYTNIHLMELVLMGKVD